MISKILAMLPAILATAIALSTFLQAIMINFNISPTSTFGKVVHAVVDFLSLINKSGQLTLPGVKSPPSQ